MPQYQLNQFEGLVIQRTTELKPGSMSELMNAQVVSDGSIRSRQGSLRVNTNQLSDGSSTNVHSHCLYGSQRYVAVGSIVKRGGDGASPNIITGLNGKRLTFVHMSSSPAVQGHNFTFFANGEAACRKKDDGTTTYNWGIDGPTASAVAAITPTIASNQPSTTTIFDFSSALTVVGGIGTESNAPEPYATSARMMQVPAGKTDRFKKSVTVDCSTQGESGFIRIMLRVDTKQNLDSVEVAYSTDGNAFTNDYYYTKIRGIDFDQDNSWQEFKVPKDEYQRVRTTGGTADTWANIDGLQITVSANPKGQVFVSADDARVEANTHAEGTMEYRVTLWNDTLKIRSNGRRLVDVYSGAAYTTGQVSARRQRITVARPSDSGSWDSQVSHWELWRRNINVSGDFFFVARNTVATASYNDDFNDIQLGEALIEDNHIPPPAKFIVGPLDNRMFALGMANVTTGSGDEESAYAIRWSRAGYPESWPLDNYALVGDPVDTLENAIIWRGQLVPWTKSRVWQMEGRDGVYNFLPTEAPIGTTSPYALAASPIGIFNHNLNGIYVFTGGASVKVSSALDPLFQGQTIVLDGQIINPIDSSTVAKSEDIVGTVFGDFYIFAYSETGGVRSTLWYNTITQSWHKRQNTTSGSGWAVQRLAWEKTGDSVNQADNLEAGTSDGWLVLLTNSNEVSSIQVDAGSAAIPFAVQTKAFDPELKSSDVEISLEGVTIDIDTGGHNLIVQISLDGAAFVTLTSTLNTLVRDKVFLPVNSGAGSIAYRAAVRISGNLSTSRVQLYEIDLNYFVEPVRVTSWATDYTKLGWDGQKYLRELTLEANTFGQNVTVTVEADGTDLAQTFTLNTASRRVAPPFSFNLHEPLVTELRLKFTSTTEWKLYDEPKWDVIQEPLLITRYATERSDNGWDGEKIYNEYALECDPLGHVITVLFYVDDVLIDTYTLPAGTGRKIYYHSLAKASELERRGTTWYAEFSSTDPVKLYRTDLIRFEKEPVLETFFKTRIDDNGWPGEKLYRSLSFDVNTRGTALVCTAYIDGAPISPMVSGTFITADRQQVHLSIPRVRGRHISLVFASAQQFSYYDDTLVVDFEKEPITETYFFTQPSFEGYPAEKMFRQCFLEIDTQGNNCALNVLVDGVVRQVKQVNTSARLIQIISLDETPEGRLVYITIQAAGATRFRYYSVSYEFVKRPPGITFFDSTPTPLFSIKKGWLRLAQVAIKNSDEVTATIYLDGATQFTFTIPPHVTDDIYTQSFPIGLTGKIGRVTLASDGSFQLFPNSYIESHQLNADRKFDKWNLTPVQEIQ